MIFLTKDKRELQDELLRRMAEPEELRKLRRQAETMRDAKAKIFRDQQNKSEADRLRDEIRRMGGQPCV